MVISQLFSESFAMVKGDPINLPAAIFAQAQHLKSDANTKRGLPIPLLNTFNPDLASKLYEKHYDALCLSRDINIVGASFVVSKLIDLIITLVHGLLKESHEQQDLYEVRTKKILLLSNSIASSSSVIATAITKNPKTLDIGGLLNTISHLFLDVRFITQVKREFIQNK